MARRRATFHRSIRPRFRRRRQRRSATFEEATVHRGTKPAGQPRTLRTIAEGKAIPAKFDTPIEFDAQAGIPASTKGAG